MSESLLHIAEAMYTQPGERVEFDRQMGGMTYGRTEDGYFVFNTGNRTRDAVASVFLNEVGIDNFSNAITAARGGEYGRAALQTLYGVTQAGLILIPGVNVARGAFVAARAARVASGSLTRAFGSRLLQVPRNARYALSRFGEQPTIRSAIASLVPRWGSTARQLREGRRLGLAPDATGTWRSIGATRTGPVGSAGSTPAQQTAAQAAGAFPEAAAPWAARVTGQGAVGPAATPPAVPLRRLQQMREQRRAVREGIQGTRASIPAPGTQPTGPVPPPIWRQRLNYSVGRSPIPQHADVFPGTGFAASPVARTGTRGLQGALGFYAYSIGDRMAENRAEVSTQLTNQTISAEADAADQVRQAAVDEQIAAALSEIQPGGVGDQAAQDVQGSYNASIGALNFQYDRAVNELRSMYELAETEDEKARLRFILADIQAQHEAGQRAITNVFERKRAEVAQLTEQSRENTLKSAQRAFDLYEVSANQLKDMLEASRQQMAGEVYGFGAAAPRDQSEYVQLLSAMAPVAQESRQAIGDIGTQGLEWLGAVMGEQTAARGADLQRLAMSTRSAAISQHQQQVDARVNAERMALAQAVQSLRERQASEAGAMQRAMLGQTQDQAMFSPVDVQSIVESAVMTTGSVERAIEQYRIYIAGKPNPLRPGETYPMEPPQFVIDAIRETKRQWDAIREMEEAEMMMERQDQRLAAEGMGLAIPGAGG